MVSSFLIIGSAVGKQPIVIPSVAGKLKLEENIELVEFNVNTAVLIVY